jgi:two-component system, chemotaxis family, CheB/CheR fusion protein
VQGKRTGRLKTILRATKLRSPSDKGKARSCLLIPLNLPVLLAVDRLRLEPNCVFVGRPGYLGVKGERLRFRKAKGRRSPPLPIDYFFRSLAEDQQAFAVSIVLSGNGSDGAAGIGTIKEQMGLVMAQDPQSAKYPGMPARAIGTRLVDYVLPASRMARRLVSYLKGPYYNSNREDLVAILPLLRN